MCERREAPLARKNRKGGPNIRPACYKLPLVTYFFAIFSNAF